MNSGSELRIKIKKQVESLEKNSDIYELFKSLNYPKETIFDPSYIKKKRDFSFAKEENEKIRCIYTVMSYDKLNVFLIEADSLSKSFVRYITNKFAEMYTRCLLIITMDYSEIQFIFPDFEKKEIGKHKLKTTTLSIKKDDIYYTDIETISNIYLEDQKRTWREIWRIWKDAFNVQKVTEKFFDDYKKIFFSIRKSLKKQKVDTKNAHEFTLQFLNRIMFIYFIAKKEWLNKDKKFMKSYWDLYKKVNKYGNDEFYSKWLKPLFFEAFNNKSQYHPELPEEVNKVLTQTPYLNGGLFAKKEDLDDLKIILSDNLFKEIFDFFESYNFTIKEDSILDIEVSVDPQMIGYVYESLANISEDVYEKEEDLRGDWGIFYTARVEVDFMCRRSLVEYLSKNLEIPKAELYEFVFDEDKERIEKKFNQRKCWRKIEEILENLSIVDPACGSGAFLVGMLNVLVELYKIVYKHIDNSINDFNLKYRIVQRALYGVDVMPWAIHASELRLWLQLIVETPFKEEELRKHPLLPNLNMNLRIGDSLVQEIGGISFNVRGNNLKSYLKNKLSELKNEKRKYFENSPSAKYKTPEEFKKQEILLFEEIINERIESLEGDIELLSNSKDRNEKQTGLFGTELNIDAKNMKKEINELQKIEVRIQESEKEIHKLSNIKKMLHLPDKKPFVWDIDFAEVFADKGGFDIVIGNPPYVRQEKIAAPNKLKEEISAQDRKEYRDKLTNSVSNRFPVVTTCDKKSDLYIYFYYHGLSLLNPSGVFCFITSNSWLDVGYGKGLQEFLLRYSHIIGIYDNQAKRSFEHADVNTIIALLGAPQFKKEKSLFDYGASYNGNGKATYFGFNQTARFVMFKKPFEEVINTINLVNIENGDKILTTEDFRAYPINQEELLDDGWEYPAEYTGKRFTAGKYEGNKWGGKYLRAPEILFTILQKGESRLKPLSQFFIGERYLNTGGADGFYIITDFKNMDKGYIQVKNSSDEGKEDGCPEFKVESKFWKPLIKDITKKEKKLILTKSDALVLNLPLNKKELNDYRIKDYVMWGEKKGFNKRSVTKLQDPWYKPTNQIKEGGEILLPRSFNDIFTIYYNPEKFISLRYYRLHSRNPAKAIYFVALFNSTLSYFFIENFGNRALGQGVLDIFMADFLRIKFPIIDNKLMVESFKKMAKRDCKTIYEECGINPLKPIREQNPNPLPDRAELDNIIFDELGLTKDERKEVYWALCELVNNRLNKARSLKS